MNGPHSSDADDLEQAARPGDAAALAGLLERYLPRLRAFVRLRVDATLRARESCSDLVQTVCREVLQDASQFEFRGEPAFRGWLFRVALNKIRDRARYHMADRRSPRAEEQAGSGTDGGAAPAIAAAMQSPSQAAIAKETAEAMEQAFDLLPEHYREVITLSRIAGLSHKEIGEQMGKGEGAVRMLLSRALVAYVESMDRVQGRR